MMQPSFAAGELSPSLWARTDLAKYHVGARTLRNMVVQAHGGASNRPGTLFLGEVPGPARLIPFEFSVTQAYLLVFTEYQMRIVKDGGFVVYPPGHASEGQVVVISSPYTAADLDGVRFTQSSDMLFLTHPGYDPRSLTRTDHHLWTFATLSFEPAIPAPTGLTATPTTGAAGRTYSYMVAQVQNATESKPSSVATATIADPWVSGVRINLSWSAASGAESYEVYKNSRGQWGWIGRTTGTTFVDDNIDPDVSTGPRGSAVKNFNVASGRPAAVSLFQQRLALARSDDAPSTVWMSRTGDLTDFTISDPLRADDTVEVRPASGRADEIRHLVAFDGLLVFTAGAEWVMRGADGSLKANNVQFDVQSWYGCSSIPPLVAGKSVLFVQRNGRAVRDFLYDFNAQGYAGNDMTVLARHVTEPGKITSWAYAQNPDGVVWCTREDGALLGFTYLREHDVHAWHRHDTDGAFLSVASISGDDADDVFFCVRRTIGGSDKYYIEQLADRIPDGGVFMDSALSYSGAPTSVLSGLSHLEGKDVAVLADKNVVEHLSVSGGQVTLPHEASEVHVGLPYVAQLETLDLDLGQDGANQGRKQTVANVVIRVRDTRGMFAGPDLDHLTEVPFRSFEGYNEPTALYTGDKAVVVAPQWGRSARVAVSQPYPLPITVLAALPELEVGG